MKRALLASFLLAGLTVSLSAQGYRHTDQTHVPDRFSSLEQWLGRADAIRTHILVSAGLWPMPAKTPLDPRLSAALKRQDYSAQAVTLETWPGFYLVGNLYRPIGKRGPFPAILSAHGHWKRGRFENTAEASVPGRAITLARQGYIVFSYSMIGYDEMSAYMVHRVEQTPQRQIWGFSAMGLQLWNSIRALDFLASLPDVDPTRIGMTGASGGATQTLLLAAVDARVRVAAPVNMVSAHFQGGCVCENGPLLRIDCTNVDIAAALSPRPCLLVSATGDWTKNTPQVEFPALKAVYSLFGASDRIANIHLDYPHNYNKESREAVYSWFGKWLLGRTDKLQEPPFEIDPREALQASLPQTPVGLEQLGRSFVAAATAQIGDACPGSWRDILEFRETFGVALSHALDVGRRDLGTKLEASLPRERLAPVPAVLVVGGSGADESAQKAGLQTNYLDQGWLVFTLNPYPDEQAPQPPPDVLYWTTYNPTPAAMRVAQIRDAVTQILARPDVRSLDVIGLESAGPLVLLARAFEPRVRHTSVQLNGRVSSDEEWAGPLFVPLIRRAGDLRTAAVMIAPGRLTVHGLTAPELGSWFERVYKAAGATDMLVLDQPGR